jgi:hypothetical protein
VSSIPKTTLFHRVVKVGMSMAGALALGRGRRGRRLAGANARTGQTKAPVTTPTNQPEAFDTCDQERPKKSLIVEAPSDDCRTGAADRMGKVNVTDADSAHPTSPSREKLAEILVRRDGIEPPTRGFSSRANGLLSQRVAGQSDDTRTSQNRDFLEEESPCQR